MADDFICAKGRAATCLRIQHRPLRLDHSFDTRCFSKALPVFTFLRLQAFHSSLNFHLPRPKSFFTSAPKALMNPASPLSGGCGGPDGTEAFADVCIPDFGPLLNAVSVAALCSSSIASFNVWLPFPFISVICLSVRTAKRWKVFEFAKPLMRTSFAM